MSMALSGKVHNSKIFLLYKKNIVANFNNFFVKKTLVTCGGQRPLPQPPGLPLLAPL
jgi:hypothetical protein